MRDLKLQVLTYYQSATSEWEVRIFLVVGPGARYEVLSRAISGEMYPDPMTWVVEKLAEVFNAE